MQYIDDLLIGSPSKEACEADSLALLKALAAKGHKVGRLPDYAKPFTLYTHAVGGFSQTVLTDAWGKGATGGLLQ